MQLFQTFRNKFPNLKGEDDASRETRYDVCIQALEAAGLVEQVVSLLRQIEVAVANGKTTALACKEAFITEQT